MNMSHKVSIARSLVLVTALCAQAALLGGCVDGSGGGGVGEGDIEEQEVTNEAGEAITTYPVFAAAVMSGNGGGVWSNSDNTSGSCGLFRNFVIAGSDPQGTVLNPVGNWSTHLNQTLTSGHHMFTMLGTSNMASSWGVQLWFDGSSTPLELNSTSPNGTITLDGVTVTASVHVYASTIDRVGACTVSPDSVIDTVGYIVLTVPY